MRYTVLASSISALVVRIIALGCGCKWSPHSVLGRLIDTEGFAKKRC